MRKKKCFILNILFFCDLCGPKHHYIDCSFKTQGSIKMDFGQILAQFLITFSNLFLALLGRRETSFNPVYDFDKMATKRDLLYFSRYCLQFLAVSNEPVKKSPKNIRISATEARPHTARIFSRTGHRKTILVKEQLNPVASLIRHLLRR